MSIPTIFCPIVRERKGFQLSERGSESGREVKELGKRGIYIRGVVFSRQAVQPSAARKGRGKDAGFNGQSHTYRRYYSSVPPNPKFE